MLTENVTVRHDTASSSNLFLIIVVPVSCVNIEENQYIIKETSRDPVARRMDNVIHRISRYPADSLIGFVNTAG